MSNYSVTIHNLPNAAKFIQDDWTKAANENFEAPLNLRIFMRTFTRALAVLPEICGSWFTCDEPFINEFGDLEILTSAGDFFVTRTGNRAVVRWNPPYKFDMCDVASMTLTWSRLENLCKHKLLAWPASYFGRRHDNKFKQKVFNDLERCVRESPRNPNNRPLPASHYN